MANEKQLPVAVITGVGPGLGASLARRFAKNYAVAINARKPDFLHSLASEIKAGGGTVLEVAADIGNKEQVQAGFKTIRERLGPPELLINNADSSRWGNVTEITPEQFEQAWRVNAYGGYLTVREVVGEMIARGRGTILFTGATAGVKAGPKSVAFGPAKFAARGLAQSLARDLGPKGIHVAWINIDGGIGAKKDGLLDPDAIAETYWHLAHQDRSAWTMELELRPYKEKF